MNAQEQIELSILRFMEEETPREYRFGWYMPIRYIEQQLTIDFAITRGFLHSMKTRGLVEFGRGFNDDGLVAGSGYTLTARGELHVKALREAATLIRTRIAQDSKALAAHRDARSWAASQ